MRRLIAESKPAIKGGLYATAVKLGEGVYFTGQERSSDNLDGLTFNEMIGKDPLSKEKAKKYPFVINPLQLYHFLPNYEFVDKKGDDEIKFILATCPNVAPNKKSFKKGVHDFYIENKDLEAKEEISNVLKSTEAIQKLKDKSTDEQIEIFDYLYIVKNNAKLDRTLSSISVRLQTALGMCFKEPDLILKACDKENRVLLTVSKLITKGIIQKKGNKFYDNKVVIATDFASLINYYQKNTSVAMNWEQELAQMEGNTNYVPSVERDDTLKLVDSMKDAILDQDKEKMIELYKKSLGIDNKELDAFTSQKAEMIYSLIGPKAYFGNSLGVVLENETSNVPSLKALLKKLRVPRSELEKLSTKEDILTFVKNNVYES